MANFHRWDYTAIPVTCGKCGATNPEVRGVSVGACLGAAGGRDTAFRQAAEPMLRESLAAHRALVMQDAAYIERLEAVLALLDGAQS